MKNKTVGYILISISGLIGFITYSFHTALSQIVEGTCEHGSICPMYATIDFQTNMAVGIIIALIALALILIFKPDEVVKKKKKEMSLEEDEKTIVDKLKKSNGNMYQSKLIEQTEFGKVKMTRLLDSLERKKIIKRERRGMSNIVILKI